MDHVSNDHKDQANQHENSHKPHNEMGILVDFTGKSMETETIAWSEFPNRGKATVEQILASEYKNKSKRPGLWTSQSGIWVGKLTIWVRLTEIEKL